MVQGAVIAACVVLAAGCRTATRDGAPGEVGTGPAVAMPVPAVSGSSGAPATPMTVIGRALNVKGGPIVLDENGTRTWVDLPGEWPPSVVGQRVVVEGQLEKRIGPLPTDGTKPLVQAITGDYWILTKVRYRQE